MDASRRSAPAGTLKKARLAPSPSPSPSPSAPARGGNFNKRESNAGGGGNGGNGGSRSALQEQQQHLQELVVQYKAALAELTFNSKPIITNLTIIAGENMYAARAIAAVVLENILEVPSEQKLPSLYLLDSIVKNIGRDYIKHFAARLPEVFCKAYAQVDPSIHTSMKHLFRTWKGVFSPATLQLIDKELGFQQMANGSTGPAVPKADSQSQRQSHSIHVNPKYLEARQQLQQPMKGVQRSQKTSVSNLIQEKQVDRETIVPEYPETSQQDLNTGRARLRSKNQDVIGGTYNNDSIDFSEGQMDRNKYLYGNKNFHATGPSRSDANALPVYFDDSARNDKLLTKSWRNSEEEEYSWDDLNSVEVTERQVSATRRKRDWDDDIVNDPEALQRNKWLARETDRLESSSQNAGNFPRSERVIGTDDNVIPHKGRDEYLLLPRIKHEPGSRIGMEIVSEGRQSLGSLKSSRWIPDEKIVTDIAVDNAAARFIGQSEENNLLTGSPPRSISYKGLPRLSPAISMPNRAGEIFEQQRNGSRHSTSPSVQSPSTSAPYRQNSPLPSDRDHHSKSSQYDQKKIHQEALLIQNARTLHAPEFVDSLLENPPQRTGSIQSSPAPRGPPPSKDSANYAAPPSQTINSMLPPLTSALRPPSSSTATSSQIVENSGSFSSLLSSLVAKGLISSPSVGTAVEASSRQDKSIQGSNITMNKTSESAILIPNASSSDKMEGPATDVTAHAGTKVLSPAVTTVVDQGGLIGLEFKYEVTRKYHPQVISSLFEDLNHQCRTCGLRFKHEDQFNAHSARHGNGDCDGALSRKWYIGFGTFRSETDLQLAKLDADEDPDDTCEDMVPADESQIICALCGQPFQDFYSEGTDEWMYRDAVYVDSVGEEHSGKDSTSLDERKQRLIVHSRCKSGSTQGV